MIGTLWKSRRIVESDSRVGFSTKQPESFWVLNFLKSLSSRKSQNLSAFQSLELNLESIRRLNSSRQKASGNKTRELKVCLPRKTAAIPLYSNSIPCYEPHTEAVKHLSEELRTSGFAAAKSKKEFYFRFWTLDVGMRRKAKKLFGASTLIQLGPQWFSAKNKFSCRFVIQATCTVSFFVQKEKTFACVHTFVLFLISSPGLPIGIYPTNFSFKCFLVFPTVFYPAFWYSTVCFKLSAKGYQNLQISFLIWYEPLYEALLSIYELRIALSVRPKGIRPKGIRRI